MNQLAFLDADGSVTLDQPPKAPTVDEYGFLIPSTTVAPGQKFVPGDRVVTRWGRATVLKVWERPHFDSPRSYHVKHDWSDAPPGFGHQFGENECEPAGPEPVYEEEEEA